VDDVYKYLGSPRCCLNIIYARVSTSKQKAGLTPKWKRLSRVGFGTSIVVTNGHSNDKLDSEEIMNDIITLIRCFSLRALLKKAR
jgi:predicted site-specific integrase-resolvase